MEGITHQLLDKTIQRREEELLSKINYLEVNCVCWFLNQKQGKFMIFVSAVWLGNKWWFKISFLVLQVLEKAGRTQKLQQQSSCNLPRMNQGVFAEILVSFAVVFIDHLAPHIEHFKG
jgi:hypothetical protein